MNFYKKVCEGTPERAELPHSSITNRRDFFKALLTENRISHEWMVIIGKEE